MDTPIKQLINLIFVFAGTMLLISALAFYLLSTNAKSVMYSVVEYIEVNDPEHVNINEVETYCQNRGVSCSVVKVTDEAGIDGNAGKNRYIVNVSFSHVFAWVNLEENITLSSLTRAVEY